MRLRTLASFVALSCVGLGGCATSPQRWYTPREVLNLTSLPELMRVQAERTDAVFAIRGYNRFTDDQFKAMFHAGVMLQVSGARISQRFGDQYGADFAGKANQLVSIARALERSAEKRDHDWSRHYLQQLHDGCVDCHDAYR